MTGNEALVRALGAARIRAVHGFVGVPLHRFVEGLAARPPAGLSYRPAQSDITAASLALGGALLSGGGTCLLLRASGMNVALEALATLGLMNELRSPVVIIAGYDAGPQIAATAQDDRGTLAQLCRLPQLEPGSPDELYHHTRLAVRMSRAASLPVVIRVGSRVLEASGEVHELPADPESEAPVAYSRSAGPFVLSSATYRYHADKRARRLAQLEAFAGALATRTSGDGGSGVILAGHLGPRAQARVAARKIPSLRLGAAWPLPRRLIEGFLRDKREVLVLEEGEPFLERELQAIALSASGSGPSGAAAATPCRVRGVADHRPVRLDDERLEAALSCFGAAVVDTRPEERDLVTWRTSEEALSAVVPLDMEPWPLFLARARNKLWGFSLTDPRAKMLAAIRASERPSIIVADPSAAALLGFRDQLIDVKAGFGEAPSLAAALTDATEVEERSGTPLCVALLGDLNLYQSSLIGILDNVAHQRDVLHVILVREGSDAAVLAGTLPEQLRAFGMSVRSAVLDDPGLEAALRESMAEAGPRALVCHGAPGREDAIGG